MTSWIWIAVGGWLAALALGVSFWRTGTQFLIVRDFLRDLAQRPDATAVEAREVLASLDRKHR